MAGTGESKSLNWLLSTASEVSLVRLELASSNVVKLILAVFSKSLAIQFCIVGSEGSSSLPSTEKTTYVRKFYVQVQIFINSEIFSECIREMFCWWRDIFITYGTFIDSNDFLVAFHHFWHLKLILFYHVETELSWNACNSRMSHWVGICDFVGRAWWSSNQ